MSLKEGYGDFPDVEAWRSKTVVRENRVMIMEGREREREGGREKLR